MSDLIDRDALRLMKVKECAGHTIEYAEGWKACIEWIKTLPSAEPERKKGKWQRRKDEDCWECSECHAVLENSDIGNHNFYYCYHCGADMMDICGYMDLERVMSEKTTSEFMLDIASHYLMNGCDACPFYNVTKTCDSKPINCTWMALRNYFKTEESKEESESTEPERKWIPVSEALPKDMDRLLVTIVRSDGSKRVRSGHYYKGLFMIDNGDTWKETDKEILAWMPLVEPWRGE